MKFEKYENESYDQYTLRMIEDRSSNGFEYDELFELLTGVSYANDNARKSLSGIKAYLMYKESMSEENAEKEIARLSQKESIETKADNSVILEKFILANETELKSPKRIMEILGYDPNLWELTSSKISKWNVSAGTGNYKHKVLYSVKATVKPIIQEFDIDWIKEQFDKIQPLPQVKKIVNEGKKIVELNYADVHVGLQGLEYEEQLNEMTDRVIDKYKDVDVFILPIGQDLLNSNHNSNGALTTKKGTIVESGMSYKEMVQSGLRVCARIIDNIVERTNAKVDCLYVKGNHDEQSAFAVFMSLMERYRNNPNIEFDDSFKARKYRQYGVNGIGFGHGDKEGKRIFGLFQIEAPMIFAQTKFREIHLSHLHNESVKNENGIMFRRMPTVNKPDQWHEDKGFVGATHRLQTFRYDTETGLEGIDYFYLN